MSRRTLPPCEKGCLLCNRPRKPTRMRRIGWQIVWHKSEEGMGDCVYRTKADALAMAQDWGTVRAVYVKVEGEGE